MEENCKRSQGSQSAVVLLKKKKKKKKKKNFYILVFVFKLIPIFFKRKHGKSTKVSITQR